MVLIECRYTKKMLIIQTFNSSKNINPINYVLIYNLSFNLKLCMSNVYRVNYYLLCLPWNVKQRRQRTQNVKLTKNSILQALLLALWVLLLALRVFIYSNIYKNERLTSIYLNLSNFEIFGRKFVWEFSNISTIYTPNF